MNTKKCSKCLKTLPANNFKKRLDRKIGLVSKCIYCSSPKMIRYNLIEGEIWKDIPGYEGLYKISDKGRILSLSKELFNGKVFFNSSERLIRVSINNKGYYFVEIVKKQKKQKFLIHVLLAIVFLNYKPSNRKIVVDHINNNSQDNRLENLQIITQRENLTKESKIKSSNYIGVYWSKYHKKWESSLVINNKKVFIGRFNNEELARDSYNLSVINIDKFNGDIKVFRNFIKSNLCSK